MTVRLTRIYTKTGDAGQTHLGDMSRVAKTDPRLVAYADVDEANSVLGVALALGSPPPELTELVRSVQNDLFDVGADLSTPITPDPQYPPLRVTPAYTERLEAACDAHNAALPTLTSFINRLSDLLFILSRVANPGGDVLWEPGAHSGAHAQRAARSVEGPAGD